jgi:hypothetical protein
MQSTNPEWPDRSWVTAAELAAIARRNERTIHREIERRNLHAERAGGAPSPWIIERAEAERWLAQYKPERTAER